MGEDLCAADIETLRGWADAGVDGRLDLDVVQRIATLESTWDACLAACEFRDVEGNPGPDLRATIDQFRTNESWVRGIATTLAEAPIVDGIATRPAGEVAAAIDGSGRAPDTAAIDYDQLEVIGLPITSGLVNDPVNAANGNFVHTDRDLAALGFGAVLDVVRTYNSIGAASGVATLGHFGPGWTSMLDVSLDTSDVEAGIMRLTFTDGAIVTFHSSPHGPNDSWLPNTRRGLRLTRAASAEANAVWVVTRDHGRRAFHFDADGALVGGAELAAVYHVERTEASVTFREERSGRWVRYDLDADGLVVAVTSSDGRRCHYRYGDHRRCVAVSRAIGDLAYRYDDAGFLRSAVDADGVAAFVNEYDSAGRVVGQVAPHGRRTRFDYLDNGGTRITEEAESGPSNLLFHDRDGNLLALYGSDGAAMRAVYDQRGRMVRHVDRAGAATTYDYTEADLIARRTDPDGRSEHREYDDRGRLVRQRDRSGAEYRFRYDGENPHPVRIDGPDGVTVATTYDHRWLPTEITDGDGVTTTFEWNTDGQLASCRNGVGDLTALRYDDTGQLTAVVEPTGRCTTLELDEARRVQVAVGADGVAQRFTYSPAGRVLSMATSAGPGSWTASYGAHGDVVEVSDATGATVGLRHDRVGNIVAMTAPDGSITTQEWDGLGQLVAVTDPTGNTTSQTYDRAGRPVSVTHPNGRTFTREVDVLGRTITVVEPDGATWHRSYHPNGQLAAVTDPTGAQHRFELDAVGRLVAEVGPDGARRTFTYSAGSRLRSETTPAGRTITRAYDAAGRLVSVVDADSVRSEVAYGIDGQPSAITDGDYTARLTFDGAGRVSGWSHDEATDSGGGTVGWGPDSVSVARGDDDPATFGFDPRRLLAEIGEPSGVVTRIERDIRGRLTGTATGTATGPVTTAVEYDPSGAIARSIDGAGVITTYRHNAGGQLETMLFGPEPGQGRGGRLGISFHRDRAGRPTRIATLDGAPLASFAYDSCGRLTAAASDGEIDAEAPVTVLTRDHRGFLTEVAEPGGTTHYERDADGLVVAMVDSAGRRTAFRRSPAGRLEAFADAEAGEVPLPAGGAVEGRDAAGRLTVDRHGRRYAYDVAGRLADAASPSGERWAFTYNDLGLLATDARTRPAAAPDPAVGPDTEHRTFGYDAGGRLVRLVDGGGRVTRFTYDAAGRRVRRVDPDGGSVAYTWDGLDRLRAVTSTASDGTARTRRFTHDGLGHVVAVDDVPIGWDPVITNKPVSIGAQRYLRSGLAVRPAEPGANWFDGTYDDPYGSGAGDGVRLGFRGELTVDGLVFMGDRVYDPDTRAFLSKDPLPPRPGSNGSFASPYLYAWSDPVNHVDPSGREPVSIEEFEAWRERQENNRFQRAGQAIVDDPWGSLAMATVVVGGTVLLATPFAPVGAGILIGAASSAAMGLATDNFNPRAVAVSGAFGAVPGGTSVRTAFAVGAAENVVTQVVVDGRGLNEINLGQVLVDGTIGAALPFLTARGTSNVVPEGPTSDIVPLAPGSALDDLPHSPDFIVHPNGEAVPVPTGAVGPTPVDSGRGFQFTGGSGGHGLDPRVTDVRIMDPVTTGKYTYPDGYVSYSNAADQAVNPWTGQTVSRDDPLWHWAWSP